MVEIIILSLIQGITEFLPVSSSSHLILISKYFNFSNQGLSTDVSLHIGSFIAVLTFFRRDVFNFFTEKKLFYKIVLSSLPTMLVGYLLVKYEIIYQLRNVHVIGWTTLIFGILLYISDKSIKIKTIKNNFNYRSAIFIGLFQILSLIPGVSRSGIAITAARFLKFNRYDSSKISFLISIPILASICFFGLVNLFKENNLNFSIINILSIIFSFIISYLTIKYFLKYIQKFSLKLFVIYRILLGVIILLFFYL